MTTLEEFVSAPTTFLPSSLIDETPGDDTLSSALNTENPNTSYYALLGVSTTASFAEIRQAYLELSRRYHTDHYSNVSEEEKNVLQFRFNEMNTAYSVLSDERERAAYDAKGEKGNALLSLIPFPSSQMASPHDIIDLLRSFDRADKIKRMAKMLASTSSISIGFSLTELVDFLFDDSPADCTSFSTPANLREDRNENVEEIVSDGEEETNTSVVHDPEDVKKNNQEQEVLDSSSIPAEKLSSSFQTIPLPSLTRPCSLVAVKNSDSDKVLYFLAPDQEEIATFVERMKILVRSNPPKSEDDEVALLFHHLSSLFLPRMISIQHEFHHALDSHSFFAFSGSASSALNKPSQQNISFGVKYHKFSTKDKGWAAALRISFNNFVCSIERTWKYNRWIFFHELTLIDRLVVFPWLKLAVGGMIKERLNAKAFATISFIQPSSLGFNMSTESSSTTIWLQKNFLHVSWNVLNIPILPSFNFIPDAYKARENAQKVATNESNSSTSEDPDHNTTLIPLPSTPPCWISLGLGISPLSGSTTLEWKLFYAPSPLYRMGFEFSTSIPFTISPFAPPYFVVKCADDLPHVSFLKVLYERSGHELAVPIGVFSSETVWKSLMWLTVPLVFVRLGCLLYVPYRKGQAARFYLRERAKHLSEVDIARQKALLEQQALQSAVLQCTKKEEEKEGLVILGATYGVLNPEYQTKQSLHFYDEEELYSPVSVPGSPTVNAFLEQPPPLTRVMSRVTKWMYNALFSSKRLRKMFKMRKRKEKSKRAFPDVCNNTQSHAFAIPLRSSTHLSTPTSADNSVHRLASSPTFSQSHAGRSKRFPTTKDFLSTGASDAHTPLTSSPTISRRGNALSSFLWSSAATEKEVIATSVPLSLDVTSALQLLVRNSALTLPAGTKTNLTGFYNPDPYTPEKKMLKIIYSYRNQRHVVVLNDEDEVVLPQQCHREDDTSSSDES